MNVRFGAKLIFDDRIEDKHWGLPRELEKMMFDINVLIPNDNSIVRAQYSPSQPNPDDDELTDNFFQLCVQASGQERCSEPIGTMALFSGLKFVKTRNWIAKTIAELTGKPLNKPLDTIDQSINPNEFEDVDKFITLQ